MPVESAVQFTVDHHDRIIAVGQTWDTVARAHGAPALRASAVLGRLLWQFFSELGTMAMYRALFAEVRRSQAVVVIFPFDGDACCDMRLRMKPLPHGRLECQTSVSVQHPPDFHRRRATAVRIVTCCSWCGRTKLHDRWVEPSVALATTELLMQVPSPEVRHGMCPTCERRALEAVRSDQ